MTDDIFRPRTEPARTIYDAFQKEALKRSGRSSTEWQNSEIAAVFVAAVDYAKQHGLTAPMYQQVVDAERSACGHADYGAKWAYGVAHVMQGSK